jgi:ubiquinone/menaquinone biosynthesis C-methylase UbiE/uncharacterized protein YbaR (Trm112 family)
MTRVTYPVQPAVSGLSPIQIELLSLLDCPESGFPLSGWDGEAREGTLRCEATGQTYPVRDGIPNLLPLALQNSEAPLPTDADEIAEKQREMAARDAQVAAYDGMLGLRLFTSIEVPLTLRYLWPEPGHLMLEGGCGTGRMTAAFAARVRGLLCVDFSFESLRVARQKLPPHLRDRVLFVQADLSQLPLRPAAFDRVGSFGVYEHIPTPEARKRALAEMARVVKPRSHGGRFALSAYRWGPPQSWISEREGHHDGGIYFVRLTMNELKEHVGAHFDVHGTTEALLYYHLLWGRKWEPPTHRD